MLPCPCFPSLWLILNTIAKMILYLSCSKSPCPLISLRVKTKMLVNTYRLSHNLISLVSEISSLMTFSSFLDVKLV